jgi:hypothetical protein
MADQIVIDSQPSWVRAELPNQRVLYTFSGIEILPGGSFKGEHTDNWTRKIVHVQFPYPELPSGKALLVDYWSPNATVSSCSLAKTHGFAVDRVDVAIWIKERQAAGTCYLDIHAAVKGKGEVHRMGWGLSIVGRLTDFPQGHNP